MKLEDFIIRASNDLRWIFSTISTARRSGTLGDKSYSFFEKSAELANALDQVKDLIAVREAALNAAILYPKQLLAINPDRYLFNNVQVTFRQGRYLVMQGYLATTWALYDSLAKIAGILCCVDERSKDKAKPVKLPEDFLRGEKFVGACIHDHLKGAYGRPIGISYAVRNWLVHDGLIQGGIEMFKFDSPNSAPFEMSENAWLRIDEKCTNEYKADATRTRQKPFPDMQLNLLEGMVSCHIEIDEAMGFLLAWSAGAARLQAELLLPRDAIPIA